MFYWFTVVIFEYIYIVCGFQGEIGTPGTPGRPGPLGPAGTPGVSVRLVSHSTLGYIGTLYYCQHIIFKLTKQFSRDEMLIIGGIL